LYCITFAHGIYKISYKSATYYTSYTLENFEKLNRVFSISQKWDLPGYSTKPFNYLRAVIGQAYRSGQSRAIVTSYALRCAAENKH